LLYLEGLSQHSCVQVVSVNPKLSQNTNTLCVSLYGRKAVNTMIMPQSLLVVGGGDEGKEFTTSEVEGKRKQH
jgi:hypothetical protein